MKWAEFRKLLPLERRKRRTSRSQEFKARWQTIEKSAKLLPHGDFSNFPEVKTAVAILQSYTELPSFESFVKWLSLRTKLRDEDTVTYALPAALLIIGQQHPETIFGHFAHGKFVPGILPIMMSPPALYTDPLDDILSEDDLVGMSVGKVVARCAERRFYTNAETVRQRVMCWDRKPRESSMKKSHAH